MTTKNHELSKERLKNILSFTFYSLIFVIAFFIIPVIYFEYKRKGGIDFNNLSHLDINFALILALSFISLFITYCLARRAGISLFKFSNHKCKLSSNFIFNLLILLIMITGVSINSLTLEINKNIEDSYISSNKEAQLNQKLLDISNIICTNQSNIIEIQRSLNLFKDQTSKTLEKLENKETKKADKKKLKILIKKHPKKKAKRR